MRTLRLPNTSRYALLLFAVAFFVSHAGTALATESPGDPQTLAKQLLSPETRAATEPHSLAHVSEPVGDPQEQARRLLSGASRAPVTRDVLAGPASNTAVSRQLASGDRPQDTQTMARLMILGNKG
jgi:hypothetical protein